MPAGYSGTPLARKLGIKAGHRVGTFDASDDFAGTLGELPEGAEILDAREAKGILDVIVLFARDRAALERSFEDAARRLDADGGLWIGWPKGSSPLAADLDKATVQRTGLDAGLVDNKVCAIDEDWSGLRFVYRREDRPAVRREQGRT